MALRQKGSGGSDAADPTKKRRRVGFAAIDGGVEANECMKVFLVKSPDEVGSTSSICIDPFDLNHFFGEDGKIYGYKDLKINVWLSAISFHSYAEISFDRTSDGGKGITDLKPVLQNIFGETLVEKEEFLQSLSNECEYISNIVASGDVIHCNSFEEDNDAWSNEGSIVEFQVVRTEMQGAAAFLYCRVVPFVLLLVEGSTPIDVTQPGWEMLLVVKKTKQPSANSNVQLLGFAAVHHFYHYPDSTRLRLSQILVLPPYQGQGHGRRLLQAINSIALSENIYDVTAEDPSDYLQYLRACIDTLRLLTFEPVKSAVHAVVASLKESNLSKRAHRSRMGPPAKLVEAARRKLKINKKQFLRCWEVLTHLNLDSGDHKSMDNFRACIYDRVKGDVIGNAAGSDGKRLVEVPNDFGVDTSFVVFWSPTGREADGAGDQHNTGDQQTQEQQLKELVDNRMEEIDEVAKKVTSLTEAKPRDMADQ